MDNVVPPGTKKKKEKSFIQFIYFNNLVLRFNISGDFIPTKFLVQFY